jgi:hypothetical protein
LHFFISGSHSAFTHFKKYLAFSKLYDFEVFDWKIIKKTPHIRMTDYCISYGKKKAQCSTEKVQTEQNFY